MGLSKGSSPFARAEVLEPWLKAGGSFGGRRGGVGSLRQGQASEPKHPKCLLVRGRSYATVYASVYIYVQAVCVYMHI